MHPLAEMFFFRPPSGFDAVCQIFPTRVRRACTVLPTRVSLAEILVLDGAAGAGRMAPPASTGISAKLKCVPGRVKSPIDRFSYPLPCNLITPPINQSDHLTPCQARVAWRMIRAQTIHTSMPASAFSAQAFRDV